MDDVDLTSAARLAMQRDRLEDVVRVMGMSETEFGGSIADDLRYCGATPDHCLVSAGCQNGCAGGSISGNSTATSAEPVIGGATMTPGPAGVVTTDGTCGGANGNTVCGNWPNGPCCSLYGFCGNTNGHCTRILPYLVFHANIEKAELDVNLGHASVLQYW